MQELADTVVAGRYVLERELGRGGMATVWLARDTLHDRRIAIKIVRPEVAIAIGTDRFIREIQLTARLQHPSIAQLLDSGVMLTPDGTSVPWYAMPYLDGDSLRTRLAREQQLSIEDALRITEAVASALLAAHRQGIVHRDVKPENILFADAGVYVVDFGIAKALADTGSERLTGTGLSIGTPAYMSPEQTSAGSIDARSDQYSLATVVYEMLTGRVALRRQHPGHGRSPVRRGGASVALGALDNPGLGRAGSASGARAGPSRSLPRCRLIRKRTEASGPARIAITTAEAEYGLACCGSGRVAGCSDAEPLVALWTLDEAICRHPATARAGWSRNAHR